MQYYYKMEGNDDDWIQSGDRRSAFYTNLNPGNYLFNVKAVNGNGVLNARGASIMFFVAPYFYQTKAFYALSTILMGLSGWGVHRYRLHQRIKLEQLENELGLQRERSRIAQDMHDDMGANLTRISYMSEVAKTGVADLNETRNRLENISESTRDLVSTVGEIIWATDPKNDTLPRLVTFLRNAAAKLLDYPSIESQLLFPEQIPARTVHAELRRTLYLVMKEALNNIIKHADATRVVVELKLSETKLELSIVDNGKGHQQVPNSNAEEEKGNGLKNMAQRIQDAKGSFEIRSEDGKGTQIRLIVPI